MVKQNITNKIKRKGIKWEKCLLVFNKELVLSTEKAIQISI